MKKARVRSELVAEPDPGLRSNCMTVGDLIFLSGMTARAADGTTIIGDDEYGQAIVVFDKLQALVEAAGAVMDDIVKMTIFVTDISRNTLVWDARRKYFQGDFPACTLVEVSALARPEILLEIEAVAVRAASD